MRYISGTKLDERVIRCDLDPGYKEGRQFGRGKSGGQVRDEYREDYDAGRGGLGREAEMAKRRREMAVTDTYAAVDGGLGRDGANVPVGASGEAPQRKRARSEDQEAEDEGVREVSCRSICDVKPPFFSDVLLFLIKAPSARRGERPDEEEEE